MTSDGLVTRRTPVAKENPRYSHDCVLGRTANRAHVVQTSELPQDLIGRVDSQGDVVLGVKGPLFRVLKI